MSPRQMRTLADELEREAKRLTARVAQLRHAADVVEALQRELPLPSDNSYATDNGMSTAEIAKHPGPRATKGPMATLAKELGLSSLAELAEVLGETHGNVRSWNVRKTGAPERMSEKIATLRKAHQAAQAKRPKR